MYIAGLVLMGLGYIGALIFAIMVIVKIFKHAGVGLGILSIFCGPFTYIWGWLKSRELNLTKTMIGWTICLVAIVASSGLVSMSPEGKASKARNDAEMEKMLDDLKSQMQENAPGSAAPADPAPVPVPAK